MSFIHVNVVNSSISSKLGNCLFGAGKLTKNADPDKYGYNSYGNACINFYGQMVAEVPVWFLVLIQAHLCMLIRKKDILVIGEGSTQGLDDTTIKQNLNILLTLQNQEKDLY